MENSGKLTNEELKQTVLNNLGKRRKEVIASAALSEDCAVLKVGELCVVTSTDPITAKTENLGGLSIDVSVNDVASNGAEPVLALLTVIAPLSATKEDIKKVVLQAEERAKNLNIDIAGGHTEFSDSVTRIITSVTVIGISDKIIGSRTMKVGDGIIVTKSVGIEGTSIIINNKEEELSTILTKDEISLAKNLFEEISVLKEGLLAKNLNVSAMHDVTEGGVLGALSEMCEGAGLGCEVYLDKIPVLDVTKKICDYYGISPYKLISSGSMLICSKDAEEVVKTLKNNGIVAEIIGKITSDNNTVAISENGTVEMFEAEKDHLYKVL